MNYTHTHERARIDRTPVRKLTDAEVQAVRTQLQADYHAQMARKQAMYRIIAEAQARRAVNTTCTAIVLWRPTIQVTPEMLWRKGQGGIKLVECAHVNVVLTLPEAA